MDKNCNTVIFSGNRQDGIKCPRCDGPVMPQPYEYNKYSESKKALYVRRQIFERCKKHCFDLTPEQVDTVLSLGDKYEDLDITTRIDEPPLLDIQLADINSVPIVFYKGEEISNKLRVSFDYGTNTDEYLLPTYIRVEHADPDSNNYNFKTIQHNQPINDVVDKLMIAESLQCCGKQLADYSDDNSNCLECGGQIEEVTTHADGKLYSTDGICTACHLFREKT